MKDLRIVCDKVVGRLQHAIACDVCDRWQHRKCGNTVIQRNWPWTPKGLTDKPWRHRQDGKLFTEELEFDLKRTLQDQFNVENTKRANILLLGPVQAGKSSFINSVASVIKGRIADVSQAGAAATSFTKQYIKYDPRGPIDNFRLYDCMGLQLTDQGFNLQDIKYLVKGHIRKNYTFDPAKPISENDPSFVLRPTPQDQIHCIIYVIDAEALHADIPVEMVQKIAMVQEELREYELPRIMILTKIDKLCNAVEKDVANTFRSRKVKEIVHKAMTTFEIPEQYICPIRNYTDGPPDYKSNILILKALQRVLNFSEDYAESQGGDAQCSKPVQETH